MWYKDILEYAELLMAFMGSGVIVYASLKAGYLFCLGIFTKQLEMSRLRLDLGYGIILGLEFMVGADIIKSMAQPTFYDLGLLASLVVIRTFLSYFLGKELEALKHEESICR